MGSLLQPSGVDCFGHPDLESRSSTDSLDSSGKNKPRRVKAAWPKEREQVVFQVVKLRKMLGYTDINGQREE